MATDKTQLETLWNELSDVPFIEDGSYVVLENDLLIFDAGTDREEIWHWFDKRYPGGVAALMFHN